MNSILFIVTSDPRASHRPAEAIRIAAGVAAWKKLAIKLYLRGAAVLCLSEFPDELVQGANIQRYLPTLAESATVLAQTDAPMLAKLVNPPVHFDLVSEDKLAQLCTKMNYTLRF